MKKLFTLFMLSALLVSCGEEILTQNTLSETESPAELEVYQQNSCAAMRFVKPPVDILFVVDNSGSTLQSSFQQIKEQIAATVSTISNEFDYHVYIAPLHAGSNDAPAVHPLIVSDVDTLTNSNTTYPGLTPLNQINTDNFFGEAGGGNQEYGFKRVLDVINANTSNGIFRNNANTIAVMISNGDDNEVVSTIDGQPVDNGMFSTRKNNLLDLANNTLNAESFRFISLVPHSNCKGWSTYGKYKQMSNQLYEALGHDDDESGRDSRDLCSGNYASIFSPINNSIRQVLVGHKYNFWKISNQTDDQNINTDEIQVAKVSENGSRTQIPRITGTPVPGQTGYIYRGFQSGQNTRYFPDSGEPVTGLVVELFGDARPEYPECIIAKTQTRPEYFGYVVLPREPQLGTIKIEVNGQDIPHGAPNGWTYENYKENTNIKVTGPENSSVEPAINKTGYFIKMNGSAVFTSGDNINVYYKPKAI